MSKALLVAFHFPPIKASSGLERTLSLVRHLPAHGWQPLVLSASPRAYASTSDERMATIPPGTLVHRAFALDVPRHLAVAGRYPDWLALPDRWSSWWFGAVPAGLAMIRRHKPRVIWSTYPTATAHLVGYTLHRLTGVPWVADFRDPMVEFVEREQRWYPADERLRRIRLYAESRAARHAQALTFCTEGARAICQDRYPQIDPARFRVVPNGFDESAFAELRPRAPDDGQRPLTLLHSGTIYPSPDRDPTAFLRALARVNAARPDGSRALRVILRGSGVEALYAQLVTDLGLQDSVEFAPLVDYATALQEMVDVDGLLLFQGYTSNPAIPAKVYEYFRAGRPILALADADGDTARLLREQQIGQRAPLDDEDAIARALTDFLGDLEQGHAAGMPTARAEGFERARAAARMAKIFAGVNTAGR
jgi:glycosyltransferase involved in cell wall biosynthesis